MTAVAVTGWQVAGSKPALSRLRAVTSTASPFFQPSMTVGTHEQQTLYRVHSKGQRQQALQALGGTCDSTRWIPGTSTEGRCRQKVSLPGWRWGLPGGGGLGRSGGLQGG